LRRLLVLALLGLAGCGASGRVNRDRPPAPINVSAAIHDARVEVSPTRFGAGPIFLIVSNQSPRTQRLTLETAGRAAGIRRSTTAIAPQGTARLAVQLTRGAYRVGVYDRAVAPARLSVGARRPSAQNELLQP
jgi:hypothetical protein